MEIKYSCLSFGRSGFEITATIDGEHAGKVVYSRNPVDRQAAGVWLERVDVNTRFSGQGLATAMLAMADIRVREKFPQDLRQFTRKSENTFTKFVDSIPVQNIVSITDTTIIYKP